MNRVVVRVPATIANLGPGFDCLGIAIGWHNEIRAERDGSDGVTVTAAGRGADQIPRDGSNLVVRAMGRILGEPRGLRVHLTNAVPFGRGFGSSAAAIVGGLEAARAFVPDADAWDAEALVAAAAEMEGHADNAAPCVHGGSVVIAGNAVKPLGAPDGIGVVVCVAPSAVATSAARKLLPDTVPLRDAVSTAGRTALLAAALSTGDASVLLAATDDVIHQPSRFELMPDSGRLVHALRREGIAAFLAGAGPSVAALVAAQDVVAVADTAGRLVRDGWEVRDVPVDAHGARVVESG